MRHRPSFRPLVLFARKKKNSTHSKRDVSSDHCNTPQDYDDDDDQVEYQLVLNVEYRLIVKHSDHHRDHLDHIEHFGQLEQLQEVDHSVQELQPIYLFFSAQSLTPALRARSTAESPKFPSTRAAVARS